MPTIINRKGSFRVQVCVKGRRESATFDTKHEAMMWGIKREDELRNGLFSVAKPRTTVKDLLSEYNKKITPTKKGKRWESIRLLMFMRMPFTDCLLSEFTPTYTKNFIKDRLKTVSGSSVNRELNLLSHVFTMGVEWGWLAENPCHGVKRPKNGKARERIASDEELETMCKALGWSGQQPTLIKHRVAVAAMFGVQTGMRAGEICALKPNSINGNVATLIETKNGDTRHVPLSGKAKELLGLVGNCFDLLPGQIDAQWRKARATTNINDLTFHDLRHTAVTRLARKLPILDLCKMIGHRDIRQLQRYYNATAESIAKLL